FGLCDLLRAPDLTGRLAPRPIRQQRRFWRFSRDAKMVILLKLPDPDCDQQCSCLVGERPREHCRGRCRPAARGASRIPARGRQAFGSLLGRSRSLEEPRCPTPARCGIARSLYRPGRLWRREATRRPLSGCGLAYQIETTTRADRDVAVCDHGELRASLL